MDAKPFLRRWWQRQKKTRNPLDPQLDITPQRLNVLGVQSGRLTGKSAVLGAGYGGASGGGMGGAAWPSGQSPINPTVGAPQQGTKGKPSDQRFRSFAERYMIARAHLFRVPQDELAEDTWQCILDAKRAYAMIARTGQNIEPEDGVF